MGSAISVMLYDKFGERLRPIDIVEASITQEINGEYRAYITTIDKIEAEQIVELEDHDGSLQLFRLSTPSRNLEYYNAQAWHITQDLANDVILNRAWLAQTGAQAWPQLLQAGIHERRFTGTSDIPHVRQLRIVRRNVLESAIGTQDNSFVNRFGGELRRDRYTVDCLTRLGEDRGFRVAVAHNIRGLTIQTDYTQVTNRIIPTVLNEAQAAVELPEIWIDSPNIGLTTVPHTKAMHFGDIWVGLEDDDGHIEYPTLESAYAAARQQIAQMWEDGVDKPSLTVDVDFVQLGQMDQYKDIEELQTLKLGDTVTVVLDDMYYRERMSLYVWDVILKEYRRCVLGKPYNTLVAMHNSIEDAYTKAMDASYQTRTLPMITEARKRMAEAVAQAMGYYVTTVYEPDGAEKTYTHDEPKLEDSMKIEYYPEPGTKVYTNAGWNNGNPTWLYGQVDGSWIVDVLSAIKIKAEWIRVGGNQTLPEALEEASKYPLMAYANHIRHERKFTVANGTASADNDDVWTIKPSSTGWGGIYVPYEALNTEIGNLFILRFEIRRTAGTITQIGGHNVHTQRELFIDGVPVSGTWVGGVSYPGNTAWHEIKLIFSIASGNNQGVYIQPNRSNFGAQYTAEVRNLELHELTAFSMVDSNRSYIGTHVTSDDPPSEPHKYNWTMVRDTGVRQKITDIRKGEIELSDLTQFTNGIWKPTTNSHWNSSRLRFNASDGSAVEFGLAGANRIEGSTAYPLYHRVRQVSFVGQGTTPVKVMLPAAVAGKTFGIDYNIMRSITESGQAPHKSGRPQPRWVAARQYCGICPEYYLPQGETASITSTYVWCLAYTEWVYLDDPLEPHDWIGTNGTVGSLAFIY